MAEYPEPLSNFMMSIESQIQNAFVDLVAGIITLDEWKIKMQEILASGFIQAWQLGGTPITETIIDNLSPQLTRQFGYLDGFVNVLRRTEDYSGYITRAMSYAAAVVDPFWQSETWGLPLPTYPGAGDTQCLQWCKCEWRIEWIDRENGDADAYWELNPAEHCQTCKERRRQWYPLRIRNGKLL